MKTKRISVPIPLEIERAARAISAKSGCSVAAVLADFISAGQQKLDLAVQLGELKNDLKTSTPDADRHAQILEKLETFITEIRAVLVNKTDSSRPENYLSLPREAAEKLFEAAFFSSAVIAELGAGDMPGAVRQPLQNYVRSAREKSRAQMNLFLSLL